MDIKRVNGDTCFTLYNNNNNTRYLIDPWLVGSEIDCMSCFNKQYLVDSCMSIENIGKIDAIIISHEFSDHCHEETLLLFDDNIPILATKSAINRLKKNSILRKRSLIEIPISKSNKPNITFLDYNDIKITLISASGFFDYVHNALVIIPNKSKLINENECIDEKDVFLKLDKTLMNNVTGGGILYSPHGFFINNLSPTIRKELIDYKLDILLITMTEYQLPLILGGTVNLGLKRAKDANDVINAKICIDIHSEKKKSSGLIPFLARPIYPSKDEIKKYINNFKDI